MDSFRELQQKSLQEEKEQEENNYQNETDASTPALGSSLFSSSASPSFKVAAIQLTASGLPSSSLTGFWERAQQAVQMAATQHGANLILLPELFLGPYFCQSQEALLQRLAMSDDENRSNFVVTKMQQLARKYQVVLPISFYERHNNALYNTVVVIDADGGILGKYRKSHIPDGTGYQEKFYFTPGDTGFRVFTSRLGFTVGVAICWDQWFPEAARAMALLGADVLLYPTAIGTEPQDPTINSADHWQRVMQGHAAANMVPVVASNRYGTEILLHADGQTEKQRITFYGRSFITDATGAIVKEVQYSTEDDDDDYDDNDDTTNKHIAIVTSNIDPEANRAVRLAWGLFRDRRPELYGVLQTKDGNLAAK
jgi:N-carbamoylputrescine amidase